MFKTKCIVSAVLLTSGLSISCSDAGTLETTGRADSYQSDNGGAGGARRLPAVSLALGTGHACVLAVGAVKCWWSNGTLEVPTLRHPRQVGAGQGFSCALDDDGVACWGVNNWGQTTVPTLNHPRAVSVGSLHACALDDDGVKCWGYDAFGSATPPSLRHPREVSAGFYQTCALDDDGVKCWGAPRGTIPPLREPRQISAGGTHNCALDDEGVKCWGTDGAVLQGPPLRHPRQVAAGKNSTCALDDDGVRCWGTSGSGVTWVPSLTKPSQVQVSASGGHACAVDDDDVVCWGDGFYWAPDLETLGGHACLLADGGARCVGGGERGQPGLGLDEDRVIPIVQTTPTDLGAGFIPTQIASGRAFSCALNDAGEIKCWGRNTGGQLGLGDSRDRGIGSGEMGDSLPKLAFGSAVMTKVQVGTEHSCALSRDNDVFCWGRNGAGQLGTESVESAGLVSGPARAHLKRGLSLQDLAPGAAHSCVSTTSGQVYCFGKNDLGQLGIGGTGNVGDRPRTMGALMEPVNLGDGFVAKSIASGGHHVCALSDQGLVKCWGQNDAGQLGLGDKRNRGGRASDMGSALPTVDLGHGQVAVELSCGLRHCCVRTLQNTMKCWGDNAVGQLGLGDVLPRGGDPSFTGDGLPFVMTPPGERVLSIRLTANRTCARTESGLRCWGQNASGELGYGDREARGGSPGTVPRLLAPLGI